MIAFDSEEDKIKHYRVDKMRKIEVMNAKREGREFFREFDLASYAKKSFGMFGGDEVKVKLAFRNDLVGVIIDRFGKDISIHPTKEEGWSETNFLGGYSHLGRE